MTSQSQSPRSTDVKICVAGAGIIGLSTAVLLQEQCPRSDVTLLADKFTPNTTSDWAAGFWEPYLAGKTPLHIMKFWCQKTFDHLLEIVHTEYASKEGVQLVSGYILSAKPLEEPLWKDMVLGYRNVTARELQPYPDMNYGVFFTTFIVDMQLYMACLMNRFEANGGKFEKRKLKTLTELSTDNYDVVVNCTGLGSYQLVEDKNLIPIRGQIMKVHAPWQKQFFVIQDGEVFDVYVFPGSSNVTLGGTANVGDWNVNTSEEDKTDIWNKCCKYVPNLKNAKVERHWVGLRPQRNPVRVERERIPVGAGKEMVVVHNYGHGGAGITLHWGCAISAVSLVKEALRNSRNVKSNL